VHASRFCQGDSVERALSLDDKQPSPGEVELVICWEPDPDPPGMFPVISERSGVVCVHVSHAKGLRGADASGLSDPYVKLALGGMVEQTKVDQTTLDPTPHS
jgi:Ca2+-dependent lipid-binding protein